MTYDLPTSAIWPMGQPLHAALDCEQTGCLHCSRCGLGPQLALTYRYTGFTLGGPSVECGLCSACAAA